MGRRGLRNFCCRLHKNTTYNYYDQRTKFSEERKWPAMGNSWLEDSSIVQPRVCWVTLWIEGRLSLKVSGPCTDQFTIVWWSLDKIKNTLVLRFFYACRGHKCPYRSPRDKILRGFAACSWDLPYLIYFEQEVFWTLEPYKPSKHAKPCSFLTVYRETLLEKVFETKKVQEEDR